jgi:hypothetical protein
MTARKFLAIIDRVEPALPLDGTAVARIHAGFDGLPAALYDVASVTAAEGRLWIELTPDRTRCKSAERRLAALTGGEGAPEAGAPAASASTRTGCGCGEAQTAPGAATCCA